MGVGLGRAAVQQHQRTRIQRATECVRARSTPVNARLTGDERAEPKELLRLRPAGGRRGMSFVCDAGVVAPPRAGTPRLPIADPHDLKVTLGVLRGGHRLCETRTGTYRQDEPFVCHLEEI